MEKTKGCTDAVSYTHLDVYKRQQQGCVGCWQVGTDVGAPGDTQGVEVPFYRYQELNAENAGVSFLWEKLYECFPNVEEYSNQAR